MCRPFGAVTDRPVPTVSTVGYIVTSLRDFKQHTSRAQHITRGQAFLRGLLLHRRRRQIRQVRKFVGIAHNINRLGKPIAEIHRKRGERFSIQIADQARFSVDPRYPRNQILRQSRAHPFKDRAGNFVGSANFLRQGNGLPAAVGVQHNLARGVPRAPAYRRFALPE